MWFQIIDAQIIVRQAYIDSWSSNRSNKNLVHLPEVLNLMINYQLSVFQTKGLSNQTGSLCSLRGYPVIQTLQGWVLPAESSVEVWYVLNRLDWDCLEDVWLRQFKITQLCWELGRLFQPSAGVHNLIFLFHLLTKIEINDFEIPIILSE